MTLAKTKFTAEDATHQDELTDAERFYWRRYFAGRMLENIHPQSIVDQGEAESVAARCVRMADALLAELDK